MNEIQNPKRRHRGGWFGAFEFWILNLFRISIFGFRISPPGVFRISIFEFRISPPGVFRISRFEFRISPKGA
jgi:hypothetical protein